MTDKSGILDKFDKAIIWHLDVNSRKSYSKIASAVRLSKQAVKYRIAKMEKTGFIRGYRTIANLTSLGYMYCRLHIKFHNTAKEQEKQMIEAFASDGRINWIVRTDGPYDLLIGLLGKNEMELDQTIGGILAPYKDWILSYDFAMVVRIVLYNRGYWLGKKSPERNYMVGNGKLHTKQEPERLDDADKEILSSLAENARLPINAIAKRIGLSPETVSYKIKKFEKSGLIAKHFLLLDYKKGGTGLYKTLLFMNPLDEEKEKEFAEFVAMEPYIIDYTKTLAPWQMELDLEARDNEHYHEIIAGISERFKGFIRDYQTLYVLKEHKFLYCPI